MNIITHRCGLVSVKSFKGSSTEGTHQNITIEASLIITIDVSALLKEKAHTALLGKSGKTTMAGGAITISVEPGTRTERNRDN